MEKIQIGTFKIPSGCYRLDLVENRLFAYSFCSSLAGPPDSYISSILIQEIKNGELVFVCLLKDISIDVESTPESFYYIGKEGEIYKYFSICQVDNTTDGATVYYKYTYKKHIYIEVSGHNDAIIKEKEPPNFKYTRVKNLIAGRHGNIFPNDGVHVRKIIPEDFFSITQKIRFDRGSVEDILPTLNYIDKKIYLDREGKDFFNINLVSTVLHSEIKNRFICLIMCLKRMNKRNERYGRNIRFPKYILMKILLFLTITREKPLKALDPGEYLEFDYFP